MAEVLGVVASGIAVGQLAAQVGKSIIKLKEIWADMKDVPSSITDLVDQIDILDPALWEAEDTFGRAQLPSMIWDDRLASRSTTYCRRALSSITEIVDELAAQVNRPGKLRAKFACVRIALRKEQLKRIEGKLQNTVRILTLAQQSYLVALTRIQPDIIIQKITGITVTQAMTNNTQPIRLEGFDTHHQKFLPQTISPFEDDQHKGYIAAPKQSKRRRGAAWTVRLRLPMWLYQMTWELQSVRSYGGWNINLRYWVTIPQDYDLEKVVAYGQPNELQRLFDDQSAWPYVRFPNGQTLLHVASSNLNMRMIEYLLDIGLSASEVDNCD